MKEILREWFVHAPWGKIALISWGNPTSQPVLLVHGREDSAATFVPLLELLPDDFHYVAMELPGMGRSDPLPPGVMMMRIHNVPAVDLVVKHLQWTEFIYLAHSLGTEVGLFYNAIFPHRIKKIILLDPNPPIQRTLAFLDYPDYFAEYHEKYFGKYEEQNNSFRFYTKRRALDAVKRARKVSEEQAELILSRNLTPVGNDLYRLSWDKRIRYPAAWNFPEEYYYELFSKNLPPTLIIAALGSKGQAKGKEPTDRLVKKLKENVSNLHVIKVEGGHDVHFSNPERVSKTVSIFLENDPEKVKAKL